MGLPLLFHISRQQQVAMTLTGSATVSKGRRFKPRLFCIQTEVRTRSEWAKGTDRQADEDLWKQNKTSTHNRKQNNIRWYARVGMVSPQTPVYSKETEWDWKVCRQTWIRVLTLPPGQVIPLEPGLCMCKIGVVLFSPDSGWLSQCSLNGWNQGWHA